MHHGLDAFAPRAVDDERQCRPALRVLLLLLSLFPGPPVHFPE
jgi:hypothetical protein